MWLQPKTLSCFDALELKGYLRKGYCSSMVGHQVKNISTICHFNLVLYQNKRSCHDILVEVRHGLGPTGDQGIDFQLMHNFLKGTDFEKHLVEIEGRPFIKGEHVVFRWGGRCRPSLPVALNSNGFTMAEYHGNALAAAIAFKDRVGCFQDASRIATLLGRVRDYVSIMDPRGSHETQKELLLREISAMQDRIASLERDCNLVHEEYRNGVSVLRQYGIDFDEQMN